MKLESIPQTSHLPSHDTMRLFNVTPSHIWFHMTQAPVIHDDQVFKAMNRYYLLYWSAEYFLEQMRSGTIRKDNVDYHVFFHSSASLGKIKALDKKAQIKLSFRLPQSITNLPAVVYVKLA